MLNNDSEFYIKFDAEMTLMESIVIGLGKSIKTADHNGHENVGDNRNQIMNEMNSLLRMLLEIEYEVMNKRVHLFM